jgi:RHH-type rel operon transcriptional repressor/antitoxin RelB
MSINLRLSNAIENTIRDYVKANDLNLSSFMREAALEKIENEIDLKIYDKAMESFEKDSVTYSHDDVKKMFGVL